MNRNITLENDQVEPLEDWQAKAERLEELVCALLTKNQTLRMELLTEKTRAASDGYFPDLSANPSSGSSTASR